MQQAEVTENVQRDFFRLRFRIDFLQFTDNFLHCVFAIAALNDLQTRTIQTQGPLGHEQCARLLRLFVKAAARRESRV